MKKEEIKYKIAYYEAIRDTSHLSVFAGVFAKFPELVIHSGNSPSDTLRQQRIVQSPLHT